MKIIVATGNEHKMVEVRNILSEFPGEILSMKEAGIKADIVEDGTTFEENALIKARAIAKQAEHAIVLADDSGLEVDCLNKEPGIYSSRYAGEDTPYEIKNQMILDRVKGAKGQERSARFVCAIAAILPEPDGSSRELVVRGTFEGYIAEKAAGVNGFGYDPIFWVPECNCTSAELTPEEKNARSHRGNALRKMKERFLQEGILEIR